MSHTNASPRQPNIVVITCHDLGRFLGCYGVPTVSTPNLDRLAADGVRFSNAFCAAPQCSPSRASLFTGRHPHNHGVMGLTHGAFNWELRPEEQHLAQLLRGAGYTTAVIGINHESQDARRCGYDEVLPPGRGESVSEQAVAKLKTLASSQQPFFMHLGYREPHRLPNPNERDYMGFVGDYITPDDERGVTIPSYLQDTSLAQAEVAELQGAVRYLDTAVGRVLDALDESGLAHDTLVIFTTDHGLAFPRAKCSLYDPGLEIALIMRLPQRGWSGGRTISSLISNIDIIPTVLELAGIPAPESIQGKCLTPLLDQDTASVRDYIFGEMTYHNYYDPQRCIRTDRYKLIVNFSTAPSFMDPSQSWRPRTSPVVPEDPATAYHPTIELYDLNVDPLEHRNLARDPVVTETRHELLGQLAAWMRSSDDPLLDGAVSSPAHCAAVATLTQAGHPLDAGEAEGTT